MILDLPYIYPVEASLKGKRKSQEIWLIDSIPVDVPEVSRNELDVITIVPGPDVENGDNWTQKRLADPIRRVHRRGLVAPVPGFSRQGAIVDAARGARPKAAAQFLEHIVESDRGWPEYPLRLNGPDPRSKVRPARRSEIPFTSLIRDGQAEWEEKAKTVLSRMVIVDGGLWGPAAELGFSVHAYDFTDDAPHIRNHIQISVYEIRTGFRADRIDDAIAYARHYLELGEFEINIETKIDGAEMVDWKTEGFSSEMRRVVQQVVERFRFDNFEDMPRAFYDPWASFRDLHARSREITIDDGDEFADAGSALLRALEQHKVAGDQKKIRGIIHQLEPAVWRYQRQEAPRRQLRKDDAAAIEDAVYQGPSLR